MSCPEFNLRVCEGHTFLSHSFPSVQLDGRAVGSRKRMGLRSSELDESVKIITIQMGKLGLRKEKGHTSWWQSQIAGQEPLHFPRGWHLLS